MSRSHDYQSKSDVDSLEILSDKLKSDLRRHIRCIANFPVLSDAWCDMADTLGRVATVSEAEAKLPRDHEDATLWETEEAALRYILEDGKLNLCLRNMVEYKQFERANSCIRKELVEKCDKFEMGLGLVLRNAWDHVEAIQTTDLPLLINYAVMVLQFALDHPEQITLRVNDGTLGRRQEVIVMHYIQGLMKQVELIGEDRLMPIIKEGRIYSLMLRFLHRWYKQLEDDDLARSAEALSRLIDTEDFVTFKTAYAEEDDQNLLVELDEDEWLDELCDDDDTRRKLRPLLDFTRECKRANRK